MMKKSNLSSSLLLITISILLAFFSHQEVSAIRYEARLVGGARHTDVDGSLIKYYIFAEERAVISPTPEFVIYDYVLRRDVALGPNPVDNQLIGYVNPNRTRTLSESQTVGNKFSTLRWYIRSAPFGALGIEGPRSWSSTGFPLQRFQLTDWKFQTAGEYNIGFNATFNDDTSFVFNYTILVNRQPAFLANGPLPFGYNGSAWSPAPIGYVQNILGITIATSSVKVTLVLQAFPDGANWTGTFEKFTSSDGSVTFDDIVVSIPGLYTYQMSALLSDGSTKAASSVQIEVERALPITIERLTSFDCISGFLIFEMPTFLIYDSVGLNYDPRLNLSLTLTSDAPFYSYSGYESIAHLIGVTSVKQKLDGYAFEFPGVWFDLPGTFEVSANIDLPDGYSLSQRFIANVEPAPTFEFPNPSGLRQNRISQMILYGKRPPFNEILLMLASDDNCSNQASDMITWTTEDANTTASGNRSFSVVPWIAGELYPCMKVPTQSYFGGLVQHYLPQFDEQYPYIISVTVAGVAECPSVTAFESLQYRVSGWDDVEVDRQYGCALPYPSSGTIAPCYCPSHLTCGEFTHEVFTPPGLNIGTCSCCAVWIMVLAGAVIGSVYLGMLYVVYEYV